MAKMKFVFVEYEGEDPSGVMRQLIAAFVGDGSDGITSSQLDEEIGKLERVSEESRKAAEEVEREIASNGLPDTWSVLKVDVPLKDRVRMDVCGKCALKVADFIHFELDGRG